jgi:hypothetical protein
MIRFLRFIQLRVYNHCDIRVDSYCVSVDGILLLQRLPQRVMLRLYFRTYFQLTRKFACYFMAEITTFSTTIGGPHTLKTFSYRLRNPCRYSNLGRSTPWY